MKPQSIVMHPHIRLKQRESDNTVWNSYLSKMNIMKGKDLALAKLVLGDEHLSHDSIYHVGNMKSKGKKKGKGKIQKQ